MSETVLRQIEKSILQLPKDEQLLLISRVAGKLRKDAQNDFEFEADLVRMAKAKEIQSELRSIELDFHVPELDGFQDDKTRRDLFR